MRSQEPFRTDGLRLPLRGLLLEAARWQASTNRGELEHCTATRRPLPHVIAHIIRKGFRQDDEPVKNLGFAMLAGNDLSNASSRHLDLGYYHLFVRTVS